MECAVCEWRVSSRDHTQVLHDKIARLEGNVNTQARQLDEVILKWSDQVRIFMVRATLVSVLCHDARWHV